MNSLRKFVAPEYVIGIDALELVGRYATNFGARKVLIVSDPGVTAAGWTAKVARRLINDRVPFTLFNQVTPNPKAEEVMRGAEFYRQQGCDVIVAVGGGSVIDCAKGIGIVTSNNRHILAFEGIDHVNVPMPPLICIPTTAGTSADVSQFAIITNLSEMLKVAIVSKAVVPDVALIDASTTVTMDPYLTACTGMDALVHAIEAYVSTANSAVTDLHAMEAIRLIHANLLRTLAQPDNLELRSKMMLGSLQAGLAFSNASLGAVHAMAHSLGGLLDLPHGECNSILLEHVMTFNFSQASRRYKKIGAIMGLSLERMTAIERQRAVLKEIERLKQAAGIHKTLSECGVKSSDIPSLARKAMQDACIVTNPRRPNQRDIEVIYGEAL